MSINPTTNFMSNEYILGWMEAKTESIYGNMRTAMDTSDDRAHAEQVMNSIKSKIADAAANHTDGALLRADLEDAIKKYGTEFPELKTALQPVLDELNTRYEKNASAANNFPWKALNCPAPLPEPVSISKDDSDRWSKSIDGQVEAFGKADQLSMINIQEYNAQLNQAKQTASALMDAADKSASAIINHIS
ncbi:MAG TPA: hypothetical protein VER12_13865 [Polyangiaceae bacterium]|jgi:hypothetical protein|nr:hypothetical protein [Polyangiaceae bacterium]